MFWYKRFTFFSGMEFYLLMFRQQYFSLNHDIYMLLVKVYFNILIVIMSLYWNLYDCVTLLKTHHAIYSFSCENQNIWIFFKHCSPIDFFPSRDCVIWCKSETLILYTKIDWKYDSNFLSHKITICLVISSERNSNRVHASMISKSLTCFPMIFLITSTVLKSIQSLSYHLIGYTYTYTRKSILLQSNFDYLACYTLKHFSICSITDLIHGDFSFAVN